MNESDTHVVGKRRWLRRGLLAGALCLEILWPGRGLALDPALDILQYNCQTWGRRNGLPANGISSITQTQDGYLWFGTAIGLIRFDGTEFQVVDLGQLPDAWSSGIVDGLSSASNGGLWVGLESSSYGYCDGQTFSFRAKEAWGKVDSSIQYVRSVLESKAGTLWLGTDQAVLRLTDSGAYEEVIGPSTNALNKAPTGNVYDCNEDREGRIWFGTSEHGVYFWQAGKVAKIPDPALDGTTVLAVAQDQERQIWVGTTGGLRCYDTNLARKDIPALNVEVRALLADRNGGMWIGTTGQGLALYRKWRLQLPAENQRAGQRLCEVSGGGPRGQPVGGDPGGLQPAHGREVPHTTRLRISLRAGRFGGWGLAQRRHLGGQRGRPHILRWQAQDLRPGSGADKRLHQTRI